MSPELAPEQAAGPTDSKSKSESKVGDWLCLAFITAMIGAIFSPVLFSGKSISRSALLPEWDAAFASFQKGVSALYDPSLLQLFIPNYTFIAKSLHSGYLPLWNPHNGFGCPFIGDIQASMFSPLRIFFNASPNLETYNLTLVLELLLCALSTFALARSLGLGRLAALLPTIAYTFCPFNLWYLELNLGTSGCLFPLVMWMFVRAAKHTTLAASVLAGASAALLILSGHPESSFFGILSACLMLVLLKAFSPEDRSLVSRLISAAKSLLIAGIVCTGLSAPVLIPFIEYLKNSETYKYTSVSSAHVPWQGVVYNLLNPAVGGASPYLGGLVLLLIPFSLLALRRTPDWIKASTLTLLVSTGIAFVLVTQLGPVELLFTKAPMTYVITRYLAPIFLMLLTVLAAFGCQNISEEISGQSNTKKSLAYAGVSILVAAGVLLLSWLLRGDAAFLKAATFDLMLPATTFNASAWKRDIWLSVGFTASLLILSQLSRLKLSATHAALAFVILCVGLNAFSLSSAAKLSLPIQPSFFYPSLTVLEETRDDSARIISTGDHLLRPATNAVYGVNSIQAHNPLFPKRYLTFMKALGAEIDMFNQKFGTSLSPLLELTAVKFVVSQLPVFPANWQHPPTQSVGWLSSGAAEYDNGVKLTSADCWSDSPSKAAGGRFKWEITNPEATSGITWSLSLLNTNNQAVWFSDQTALPTASSEQPFLIPTPLEQGTPVKLCLRLFNRNTVAWLTPKLGGEAKHAPALEDHGVVLCEIPAPSNQISIDRIFFLQSEHDNHVRVYKNLRSLPRSYAVFNARNVNTEEESLKAIQASQFDPFQEVILEAAPPAVMKSIASNAKMQAIQAPLIQSGPNKITAIMNTPANAILVLLDNWYPGWKAYVNGAEVPMFRANYLFKAIQLPQGFSSIVFSYEPMSFTFGVIAFVITLLISAGVSLTRLRDRQL